MELADVLTSTRGIWPREVARFITWCLILKGVGVMLRTTKNKAVDATTVLVKAGLGVE